MRIAEVILEILNKYGTKHIFGIPGDAINDMTDALRKQDEIRYVLVRHEEAGAFAASAQAKLTGQLAVCMGTAGPGAIHLLNGLYDAKMDHAPVLAITGQVETQYLGTNYHQEVDLERLFKDVALYSHTITSKDQVPAVIEEACRAAVMGRGIAHISLPSNLAGAEVKLKPDQLSSISICGTIRPNEPECEKALALIKRSNRIAILAGIGCNNARGQLLQLAKTIGAPIIRTLRAKDVIDDCDPLCIGGIGMLGGEPGIKAIKKCDLLIMIGTDFPYTNFYPEDAKVIQIDRVATQIGKRHPVDVGLFGDAAETLSVLLKDLEEKEDSSFLKSMQAEMEDWLKKQASMETSDLSPIKPQRVMYEIANVAPDNSIFVCDTGTVDAWSARHLRVKESQRYTLSSALGSMAFALPGAIGAQLAFPDSKVFALAGDGGFTMLMPEFLTAVVEKLPIIVVILNNSKLGFIALEQEAKGLPEHSIDIPNPDFASFAELCGGLGFRVNEPDKLGPTLQNAIRSNKPAVIDVTVDAEELIIPPVIEPKMALNFGIAKTKEFFS